MNNITTFETSKALIAAGFHVPELSLYSFWYGIKGTVWVLGISDDGTETIFRCVDDDGIMPKLQAKHFIPAFTATDILRELGPQFRIEFDEGEFYVENKKTLLSYRHINPAEAAALAYLSQNKQQ